MNPDLAKLQPYPFEKLARLKNAVSAPATLPHIALSVGEPKHAMPEVIKTTLLNSLDHISHYPTSKGLDELRESISSWLCQRFALKTSSVDPQQHVLPVNGTREALFSFAQCVVSRSTTAKVLMPNPFYQIYEGACFLAGAEPVFLDCTASHQYLPDYDAIDEKTWQDCQLLYICNPGNPSGATHSLKQLQSLIRLAHQYDFTIAADECYSEIYTLEAKPPIGLLEASEKMGNPDFSRCVVFHSLSKRSNAPGLRSGFVAGDKTILAPYFQYRTYHGCTLPIPTQLASIEAWNDETHVLDNRRLYTEKFSLVLETLNGVLDVQQPDAGFYLWAKTPFDDEQFAQQLFAQQNVTVLPGQYLSRETQHGNPGANHVRMALVATVDECLDAAQRIKQFLQS